MEETKFIQISSGRSCRYCLSDENESDLISPCRCKGSTQYVHKKCLKQWYDTKNNRVVIPGLFNQFNFSCEICHAPYKIKYKNIENQSKLWVELSLYIFGISLLLLASYISIGLLLSLSSTSLFMDMGSFWGNVFFNGFVMTHVILGVFYLIMSFIIVTTSGDVCFCCMFSGDSCSGDGVLITLLVLIALSIIGTILIVYFDITSRVVQRHYNKSREIEIE